MHQEGWSLGGHSSVGGHGFLKPDNTTLGTTIKICVCVLEGETEGSQRWQKTRSCSVLGESMLIYK